MRRSLLSYCSPYVRWLEAQQEKLEHVLEVLAGVKTIEPTEGKLSEAHPDAGVRASPYGLSSVQQREELEKRALESYNLTMKHGAEFSAREMWKKHHKEDGSASTIESTENNSGHRQA